MIKSLHIQNFQSHKDTRLDFHKGVNVIVGPSDCGKSAVLRALDWVINNRPQGDAFRSDWGGGTSVGIALDNGIEISRYKDKMNAYELVPIEDDKDVSIFKAFGASVPDEIVEAINMANINWQRQHDAAFLLSDNPPAVARQLNSIVHLDKIDSAFSNMNSRTRANAQEQRSEEARLEEIKDELKSFDYIEDMEKDLIKIEELEGKCVKTEKRLGVLTSLLMRIRLRQKELKQQSAVLVLETELDALIEYMEETKKIEQQLTDLNETTKEIEELTLRCRDGKELVKKYEAQFKKEMPAVCPLCGRSD